MSGASRWVFGGGLALSGLAGLYLASRSGEGTLYWTGLVLFGASVFLIFNLIGGAFDKAEGRPPESYRLVGYALVAVAVGTVVFHVLSPWWWAPIASNWHYIDITIDLTFWITGVAFVIILGFMAYCVFRFRHREGRRAEYEPESTKLEGILTVVTALAVAAMLAPGLFFWNQFIDVPEDAVEVEVVGQQWSWSYRLPGADGRLGTADTRRISPDNPLGLNPDDPDGQDDIIINGGPLHLQVDTPVKMLLRSVDVLHNFYVPEFRAKMDMVPGMVTQLWFTPTRTGTFQALCAELCGTYHAYMRGEVVVQEEGDYQAWLDDQRTFARLAAAEAP